MWIAPLLIAALLLALLPIATTAPAVPTQQQACTTCHDVDRSITLEYEVIGAPGNDTLQVKLHASGPSTADGRSALSFPNEVADNGAVTSTPRTVIDGSENDLAPGATTVDTLVQLRPQSGNGPWALMLFYSVGEPHVTFAIGLVLDHGGPNGTLRLQKSAAGDDLLDDVSPDPTGNILFAAHAIMAFAVLAMEAAVQVHLLRLNRTIDGVALKNKNGWMRRYETLITVEEILLSALATVGLILLLFYQFGVGADVVGRPLFWPKMALAGIVATLVVIADERRFPRWRAVVRGEVPDAAVAAAVRRDYVLLRRIVTVLVIILWVVGGAFAHM